MIKFSSKQLVICALVAIMALGFFLRSYHFSDWLHFELDQARDARVVDDGLRGDFFDLPLLGPKAGGTTLRLPPAFYYLEYASAVVFGGSVVSMAIFVMVLSVFSIPIFYLLTRRYFSVKFALGLTLTFAVSEFFVMYSRFAWNPNLIPFFTLLGWYALLRSVDREEKYKERWFLVAVSMLALAMQFHFLAFVAIPVIAGGFFLLRFRRFSWKTWIGAFIIVGILYLPMMLNETETGFANSKAFVNAATKKSTKSEHSLLEKAIRGTSEHALYGMVITTGFERGTFPAIVIGTESGELIGRACDERCDRGKWYGVAAVFVFGASIIALVYLRWRESIRRKSDFLLLMGIWIGVTFLLFLPLAYDMAPRFFLLSGPVFFILIGLLLFLIKHFFGERKIGRQIVMWGIVLLVVSNLFSLNVRFDELARAKIDAIDSPPDRILKERIRVTLEQQNAIVDFLEIRSGETGYPVYMWSEPQYRRALKYLMEKRGIRNGVLGFDGIYQEGVYYLILRAQSDIEDALLKYRTSYTVGETISFGTLIAVEMIPKPEVIHTISQDFSKVKPNDSLGLPRYTWREFFARSSAARAVDDDTQDEIDAAL